jgi:molybdopterin-guanine dinucleotide biosynthesis protein A
VAAHLEDRLLRGERRVLDAIEALDLREIGPDDLSAFDPDGRLLANINTGDDYAAARAPGGRPLEG